MKNRQWSKTRKMLEQDLLCPALRGRVRYFSTRYRKAHDQTGRYCVVIDGKDVLSAPTETEYKIYREVHSNRLINGQPPAGKSLKDVYAEVTSDLISNGVFGDWHFIEALNEFLNSSIEDALASQNSLVRMFAILDRRVGKRTLEKLKHSVENEPEWLRYFYRLRLESEGVT